MRASAAGEDPLLRWVALRAAGDDIVVFDPFMRIHVPAVAALTDREGPVGKLVQAPFLG